MWRQASHTIRFLLSYPGSGCGRRLAGGNGWRVAGHGRDRFSRFGTGLMIMAGRARRDRRARRCRSSSAAGSSASVWMNSSLNIGCMVSLLKRGRGGGPGSGAHGAVAEKSPQPRMCYGDGKQAQRRGHSDVGGRYGRAEHSGGGYAARSRPPGLAPCPCWPSGRCGSCSARASLATQPIQPPRRPDRPGGRERGTATHKETCTQLN